MCVFHSAYQMSTRIFEEQNNRNSHRNLLIKEPLFSSLGVTDLITLMLLVPGPHPEPMIYHPNH